MMPGFWQRYQVQTMDTFHRDSRTLVFDRVDAQLFIRSLLSAFLVVVRSDRLLSGMPLLTEWLPGCNPNLPVRLRSLTYRLTASDGTAVHTQDFRHDFHGVVTLSHRWELSSADGRMFKVHALDDLLEEPAYRGLNGVQLVA